MIYSHSLCFSIFTAPYAESIRGRYDGKCNIDKDTDVYIYILVHDSNLILEYTFTYTDRPSFSLIFLELGTAVLCNRCREDNEPQHHDGLGPNYGDFFFVLSR